jgi:hypothetical protein
MTSLVPVAHDFRCRGKVLGGRAKHRHDVISNHDTILNTAAFDHHDGLEIALGAVSNQRTVSTASCGSWFFAYQNGIRDPARSSYFGADAWHREPWVVGLRPA